MEMKNQLPDVSVWRRSRYLTTLFLALVWGLTMFNRGNLSIAIVAMTDKNNTDFETFDWDSSTQGALHSSFFWGYVASTLAGGVLTQKYGVRWPLLLSQLISVVCSGLTPIVAHAGGWQGVCALRAILGVSQGVVMPGVSTSIPKWAPTHERGYLLSTTMAGSNLGTFLVLNIGGILGGSTAGWPSIFYVSSGITLVWCGFWFVFGYDAPSDSRFVSEQERNYIESFYSQSSRTASFQAPWKEIFLSRPVWALVAAVCVQYWGYYMLLTEMPTYVSNILKFDIKASGILTSLPYLVTTIMTLVFGWIAKIIKDRKILSVKWTRQLFTAVGLSGPMAMMIGLSTIGPEEKDLTVALLIITSGVNAAAFSGFMVTNVELSPNFAGILASITNASGSVISLIVPLVVGAIVIDIENVESWRIVFWITAGCYLIGNLVYLFFGSTDIQRWNEIKIKKDKYETYQHVSSTPK